MQAKFFSEKAWHAAIAAAVIAGLTFEAYDIGLANRHAWVIEYTGGY